MKERNLRNDQRTFKPLPLPTHTMVFNGSWYQCRECGQVYLMAGRSQHQASRLHDAHIAEAKARRDPSWESNLLPEGETLC